MLFIFPIHIISILTFYVPLQEEEIDHQYGSWSISKTPYIVSPQPQIHRTHFSLPSPMSSQPQPQPIHHSQPEPLPSSINISHPYGTAGANYDSNTSLISTSFPLFTPPNVRGGDGVSSSASGSSSFSNFDVQPFNDVSIKREKIEEKSSLRGSTYGLTESLGGGGRKEEEEVGGVGGSPTYFQFPIPGSPPPFVCAI